MCSFLVRYNDLNYKEIVALITHQNYIFIHYISNDMRENDLPRAEKTKLTEGCLIDFPTMPTVIFFSYCQILCLKPHWPNSTATKGLALCCTRQDVWVCGGITPPCFSTVQKSSLQAWLRKNGQLLSRSLVFAGSARLSLPRKIEFDADWTMLRGSVCTFATRQEGKDEISTARVLSAEVNQRTQQSITLLKA